MTMGHMVSRSFRVKPTSGLIKHCLGGLALLWTRHSTYPEVLNNDVIVGCHIIRRVDEVKRLLTSYPGIKPKLLLELA